MKRKINHGFISALLSFVVLVLLYIGSVVNMENWKQEFLVDSVFLLSTYFAFIWLKNLSLLLSIIFITLKFNFGLLNNPLLYTLTESSPDLSIYSRILGVIAALFLMNGMIEFIETKLLKRTIKTNPTLLIFCIISFTVLFQLVYVNINWS